MLPVAMTTPDFRQKLDQCIHCGLCLPACPTYNLFHTEMDSPRGRIALMRGAADGRIGLDGSFAEHLDLCLGCRACEVACPSGVEYGTLLEVAREAMAEAQAVSAPAPASFGRMVQRIGLTEFMPHRSRLRIAARLLALYQRLGLPALAAALPLPPALRTMEGMLPPLRLDYPDERRPAPAIGPKRGKVAFFAGCIQDAFLSHVNAATVRVLQRNGYEVHFPPGQSCCGAAAVHTGEVEVARDLARRNIDAFAGGRYDAIVNNAGGCGATLLEYARLLADDPEYAVRAQAFEANVQDITAFLAANLHNPPNGHVQARVTYVDSCHLRNGQRVVAQPRALLKAIPGIELVEVAHPDQCCGSAGIYNLLQPATANQVLDAKLADVAATQAGIIAVANTGCYMQMVYGVKRGGLNATVMHVVELLDKSYANAR
jgi:glycolate oxidase iron-sulfur subunit